MNKKYVKHIDHLIKKGRKDLEYIKGISYTERRITEARCLKERIQAYQNMIMPFITYQSTKLRWNELSELDKQIDILLSKEYNNTPNELEIARKKKSLKRKLTLV